MTSGRRLALWPLLTAGALSLVAAGTPRVAGSTEPDSLTVRVMFKYEGGLEVWTPCGGANWGWDSLTFRVSPGQRVPYSFLSGIEVDLNRYPAMTELRLGRRIAADSAWLVYKANVLSVNERYRSGLPDSDSLVVTTAWSHPLHLVGVMDMSGAYRIRLVTPWPEPPRPPTLTQSIRGRVLDDSTGCPIFHGEVVVDETSIRAWTDTLGTFVLSEVPQGERKLGVCGPGYARRELVVKVPAVDPLELRLRRKPGYTIDWPCWGSR